MVVVVVIVVVKGITHVFARSGGGSGGAGSERHKERVSGEVRGNKRVKVGWNIESVDISINSVVSNSNV